MSIIYSYPEQGVLNANDMLIGTSAEKVGGKQKNITRNFSIQQIADFVNGGTGIVDPVATDFQIAVFNQGGTKLTGSIISQDSSLSNGVAGTSITIAGDLTTTGSITTPANLTATGNVSLGGGINVVNLNSRTNLYGLIGDSTGTLGSNNQILISDNAGALVWDDYAAGLTYQGVWNATTNTPTLVSGTGTNGHFYIVDVAGDTNLNGNSDWQVGDWALFSGVTGAGGFWDKIDNTQSLTGSGTTNTMTMWTSPSAIGDSLISQAGTVISVDGSLKVKDTVEATTTNANLKLKGAGTGGVEVMGDTASATDGRIQLNCYVNSHGVTIQSPPHSDSATYTLILPANVGNANQVLTSAGAGAGAQLTWSTPTTGTVTSINYTTDFTAFTAGPAAAITTTGTFTLNKNGGTTGQYIDGAAGAWLDLPAGDTYDLGSSTDGANVRLNLDAASGADSFVTLAGSGLTIAQTNDIVTFTVPAAATVVDTFTNANGTYVSAATVNTNATGNVTTGIIDLSAVDGTSDSTTKFLSKDNTWDVPSYTTNTDTTYNLSAGVLGSNSIPLKLDATPGTDSAVNLTGGTGITLARTSGTEITITGSAQGVTSVSGTANRISVAGGNTAVVDAVTGVVNSASDNLATGKQIQTAIDSALSGALTFKGTFNAATGLILSGVNNTLYLYNCPGGAGTRVAISIGDLYIASTAGAFYCDSASQYALNIGDEVIATAAAAADASVKTGWSVVPSTGGLTGSGTTNFVPKFTSATGLSDSLVFDNGTDVGIGTIVPNSKLMVIDATDARKQIEFSNDVTYRGSIGHDSSSGRNEYRTEDTGKHAFFKGATSTTPEMLIDGSGNVGIGLIAPLSKLHVKGGSTTTQATATDFIANSTARFVTTSSNDYGAYIGYANATNDAIAIQSAKANATVHPLVLNPYGANVGIGTTAPASVLHLKSTVNNATQLIFENTNNGSNIDIDFYSNVNAVQSRIRYSESTGGFDFIPNTTSGSSALFISYGGNVGIGTDAPDRDLHVKGTSAITRLESTGAGQNAQIDFKILNVSTIWSIGSNISLANTGTLEFHLSGTTRVAMTTAGNVGINVTDPDAQLEIVNSLGGSYRLGYSGTDSYFDSENFYIRSGNGNVNKLIVNPSGNVGIGTVTPGAKLHVEGSVLVDAFNQGNETGIFFREGFVTQDKYNLSILAYDHFNSGASPDGLSINASEAISFCTGSNTRAEKMRLTSTGALSFGSSGTGYGAINQVLTSNGNSSPTWQAAGGGGASEIITGGGFGDGTTTSFPLGGTPSGGTKAFVDVFIDGVYQNESTYGISGTNVTISPAPPVGTTIQTKTTTGVNSGAAVTSVNGMTGSVLLSNPNIVTVDTSAVNGGLYIFTTATARTLTLPTAPSLGDSIKVSNGIGGAANIIAPGSKKIMNVAGNMTINVATAAFEMIFSGDANGWIIIGNV